MKVSWIKPTLSARGRVVYPAVQCQDDREIRYMNDTPETSKRCALPARVNYGNKKLCKRHAALRALEDLIGSE
jgi:hypothetical protein